MKRKKANHGVKPHKAGKSNKRAKKIQGLR